MSYDGIVFSALALELEQKLVNARVQRVFQPQPDEVRLHFRRPGEELTLLVSADPSQPRVYLTSDSAPNPIKPPNFCMVLRKHLEPGRVLSVSQPGLDRVLRLDVESFGDVGERVVRTLHIEMMGRHSNVLLVDAQNRRILDGLRHVGGDQSRHREVAPGFPFVPPPAQEKADPRAVTEEAFIFALRHTAPTLTLARRLVQLYDGFGPLAGAEIIARAHLGTDATRADLGDGRALWMAFSTVIERLRERRFSPCVIYDSQGMPQAVWAFPLEQFGGALVRHFESMSGALAAYFGERVRRRRFVRLKDRLDDAVGSALTKGRRKCELQLQALAQSEAADQLRHYGELLFTQLHVVQDGANHARVMDYYLPDAPEIEVPLDPRLTPSQNAQAYFKRYEKAKRTRAAVDEELAKTTAEITYLEQVESALDLAENEADLREIEAELVDGGYASRTEPTGASASKQERPAEPRRVVAKDGTLILVGRNNRQNDQLTLRTASELDLWLHTKEIPGSHVIVRTGGREATEETVLLAALLAARFSKAAGGSNVPVDCCLRRYVRKPRGAKPGMVIYDHQRTLYVTPGDELIAELSRPTADDRTPATE